MRLASLPGGHLKSGPFHTRINNALLRNDMQSFLAANDVVFFEWASELLALASHLPKRCPIVTRLHRYELYQWADRINWDAVDRIILVSEAKRREFVARFPQQAQKIAVIPVGVDLQKFGYCDRAFDAGAGSNIGILCHLAPRKRVYELILAFSELAQTSARRCTCTLRGLQATHSVTMRKPSTSWWSSSACRTALPSTAM